MTDILELAENCGAELGDFSGTIYFNTSELQTFAAALTKEKDKELKQAKSEVLMLREAMNYAVWQHNGGGTPIHNHWTVRFYNDLNSTAESATKYREEIEKIGYDKCWNEFANKETVENPNNFPVIYRPERKT